MDNLRQLAKVWAVLFCKANWITMEKKSDKRVAALKSMLEELNLQLHLGKADAEKAFEEQKANIRDWSVKMTSRMDEAKNLNEENLTKLRGALEDLRVQASLGKANTEDLLRDQQAELKKRLEQLRSDIDLVFGTTREHSDEFLEDLSLRLHDYQVKFDIFKLQLQLARMESDQEFEKRKAEIADRIHEFQAEVEKRAADTSDKWEQFSSEMTEAWKHIRKAFD